MEQEKPLPKPLPVVQNKDAVNSLLGLQRFYDPLIQKKELPLLNGSQKDSWTVDPLRLFLQEKKDDNNKSIDELDVEFPFQQDELPYVFKPKNIEIFHRLLSRLYVIIEPGTEYFDLVNELPFATASIFAPTPPLKDSSTTPAIPPPTILPFESYASVYDETDTWDTQDPTTAWLYESSARNSTSTLVDEEKTWEAIFHPLSTFKHRKGEIEYQDWENANSAEAGGAAVTNGDEAPKATIPHLMPTPPLKPSPVLTIVENEPPCESQPPEQPIDDENQDESDIQRSDGKFDSQFFEHCNSQSTMVNHDYFHMLQQIRGPHPVSPTLKEDPVMRRRHWTEKRLFWVGFVFPLLWFVASIRTAYDLQWQKRCRLAALYFSISLAIVILIITVKAAASRQSQIENIRAVIAN